MTTIIEKNSSSDNSGIGALAIVLIVCVLVAVGFGIAYLNGSFSGPATVIERNNTSTIEHKTTVVPVPVVVPAPEPSK